MSQAFLGIVLVVGPLAVLFGMTVYALGFWCAAAAWLVSVAMTASIVTGLWILGVK